jgi:hypothetical protein
MREDEIASLPTEEERRREVSHLQSNSSWPAKHLMHMTMMIVSVGPSVRLASLPNHEQSFSISSVQYAANSANCKP